MKYLVWIFECLFATVKYFSVRTCHSCAQCSRPLEIGQACDGADGEIYCTPCYARSVSNKGPAMQGLVKIKALLCKVFLKGPAVQGLFKRPCCARSFKDPCPAGYWQAFWGFFYTLVCTSQIYFYMPRLDDTRPNQKPPWRLGLDIFTSSEIT